MGKGEKVKSIFDAYGTDPEKAENGIWEDLAYLPGARVLVARLGNQKFQKVLRRLREPYERGARPGHQLPDEIQEKTLTQAVAEALLLGWEEIYAPNESGEIVEIPYTYENAIKLLSDPRLKDFRDDIVRISNSFESFKMTSDEEGAENLKK